MSNKIAVIAFWWGDWPGNGQGHKYVNKLYAGVGRNTTVPHDFILYTDLDKIQKYFTDMYHGIYFRRIPAAYEGLRWNFKKISMFSSEALLQDYEWVVCMDLDLVITGNVDFLLQHRADCPMTCRAAYTDDIGGSIVGFRPGAHYCNAMDKYLLGNRDFLEFQLKGSERKFYRRCVDTCMVAKVGYWQYWYPDKILSYKVDGYKPGASVVRFHGRPRPHEVAEDNGNTWMAEHWK